MSVSALRPARRGGVLITGGAGFIGTNLANRLLRDGRTVRIYDTLSRPGAQQNLRWLRAMHGSRFEFAREDVRSAVSMRAALAKVATVFHLAAQVAVTTSLCDPREDFDVNAAGTLNLLEQIRGAGRGVGLVFTSTNKVYGALDDLPLALSAKRYFCAAAPSGIDETRPLNFHSPYGCSKGAADQYVLDYARGYGVAATVFRMSCIYGPHQHGTEDQGWVAHFLIRAQRDWPITIFGDGKQVRDLLYIDDLVEALLRAEEHLPDVAGEAFNIGGGPENSLSLREVIDELTALNGSRPEITYAPWRGGDQRWYVSNTGKFERATGWRPKTSVGRGLRQLHAWISAECELAPPSETRLVAI
jgi:CDP-paratose 2-epimerase